jgi:phosphatidylserine decarboxylase
MKTHLLRRIFLQEDLNFLLTNRVPRQLLTRFMGWFSKIKNPLVCRLSIGVWRCFTDLDLSDAKKQHFDSLHDCFTRELIDGARPIDTRPDVISSPCDAIIGACGAIDGDTLIQAKGLSYSLHELCGPTQDMRPFHRGSYVTLRLTSAMYHRFHAPHNGQVEHVTYISGDTWNVNPIALKRIEKLFCRNERAVIRMRLKDSHHVITLVPVAAILVASIRLHFLDVLLHLKWPGPSEIACSQAVAKGQEMGWFEHGSTIIFLAPKGFALADGISCGTRVRMGQALMQLPTYES